MRVLTLLPPKLQTHVNAVVGGEHSVHPASDSSALHRLIRSVDVDLLIVDPTARDGLFAEDIENAIAQFQLIPTIVYTSVSAAAMKLVLRLAPLGVHHMVLYEIDDDPKLFLELIERAPAHLLVDLMLHELQETLSSLPRSVARAVELVFKSPSRARTSTDLAALAGMNRRSLYRHIGDVGLQPRQLIDCAVLLRAYSLLREPGCRLRDTSSKLGFADPQTLRDLMREATGYSLRSIQDEVPPALFVHLLKVYLLRCDAPSSVLGDRLSVSGVITDRKIEVG